MRYYSGEVSETINSSTMAISGVFVKVYGQIRVTRSNLENIRPGVIATSTTTNAVSKFIQLLKTRFELSFNKLFIFGDVEIRDGVIVKCPDFFVLHQNCYNLYELPNDNIINIKLVCSNHDFTSIVNYINASKPYILKGNHVEDELGPQCFSNRSIHNTNTSTSFRDCVNDTTMDGGSSDVRENIISIMEDDICGNMYGDIIGTMTGDIYGDMHGNIIGTMTGDIYGDMYGNIIGVMEGDIYKNMYGNIGGSMEGDIYGKMEGSISGSMEGVISIFD